jgi:hypothetical protein
VINEDKEFGRGKRIGGKYIREGNESESPTPQHTKTRATTLPNINKND